MTGEGQFCVWQMKQTPETRQMRFRSYHVLQEKGIRVSVEDYEKVYTGILYPEDTPENIRERLKVKPPRSFAGHSLSVSDVLVFDRAGVTKAYYVEKNGFTIIEDFIRENSSASGPAVSIYTTNFQIEGKAGSWLAFDSIQIAGQEFFLMEHETYGKEAAWVVVDQIGRLLVDNVRNGFDEQVKGKLEEYLRLPQTDGAGEEKGSQRAEMIEQAASLPHQERAETEKPRPVDWQKYMENGEYLRSAEISEEQNYNLIDGRKNNMSPQKKPGGRESVLAKLHRKQAEIAERTGKKERQQTAENEREREGK